MDERELINLDDVKGVMRFLQEPTVKIAEFLTGMLESEKKDWKLSGARLVQSAIKGKLLTQFGRELSQYREAGKIREDYFATHKNQASLYELLKFLDENIPDEEVFGAIKSIFFTGVGISANGQDEVLAYEFLQTAKELSSMEVLILKSNYEIAQGDRSKIIETAMQPLNGNRYREFWRATIVQQMGYKGLGSVVEKYEEHLESLGLISRRFDMERSRSEFNLTQKFRLTETGYQFCEFMTNYK